MASDTDPLDRLEEIGELGDPWDADDTHQRARSRRNAWPHLVAVVRAIQCDHEMSIACDEMAAGEKPWWRLPASKAALDALRDHLSKGER